jgi:leader peptidase (prepilin peptidase)/N-methyltransferase
MPRDESVVSPRSHCPSCGQGIAWYDNIPVLSWFLLRGSCRNCRAPISPRYPAVEFLTGVLFAAGVFAFGPGIAAVKFCVFAAAQVALVFTDLEARILPDEFTLGGVLAGLAFAPLVPPEFSMLVYFLPESLDVRVTALLEAAFSAVVLAGILWGIGAIYGRLRGLEVLGFGDVKLVACIGAFLGLGPSLLAIAAGSLIGSITGIAWILLSGRDWRTYPLPFGTFLSIAAIGIALFRPGAWVF